MIGTEQMNNQAHKAVCAKLGVDDFKFDLTASLTREVESTAVNTTEIVGEMQYNPVDFKCPVVRWWINGQEFGAAIPLHIKSESWSGFLGSSTRWSEDFPEMEKELIKLVNESKAK